MQYTSAATVVSWKIPVLRRWNPPPHMNAGTFPKERKLDQNFIDPWWLSPCRLVTGINRIWVKLEQPTITSGRDWTKTCLVPKCAEYKEDAKIFLVDISSSALNFMAILDILNQYIWYIDMPSSTCLKFLEVKQTVVLISVFFGNIQWFIASWIFKDP